MNTVTKKHLTNATTFIFGMSIIAFFLFPGSLGLASILYGNLAEKIILCGIAFIFIIFCSCIFDIEIFLKNLKSFKLNKIYAVFALYLASSWLVYNFPFGNVSKYSYMCIMRLLIFCCMIIVINLCFSLKNKEAFFYGCISGVWIFTLIGIIGCFKPNIITFVIQVGRHKPYAILSYVFATKFPLLLFLVCFFCLENLKKVPLKKLYPLLFLSFCLAILNITFSFNGKRSGLFMGIFSLIVFIIFTIKMAIKQKLTSKTKFLLLSGTVVCTVLAVNKVSNWHAYNHVILNDRICLVKRLFKQQNLYNSNIKQICFGQGHGKDISFFHNATLDLYFSVGIIGTSCWLFAFIYILLLWKRSKSYDTSKILLLIFLILTYLNSCTTGFYLYFVHMYFLMYYLEYCLKNRL